ncbi:polysaccharide biosynthesis protein [Agreia sp. COWG]|uniref:polysaccharide biosynthesis protein n=1 Tax=Agreia sp. COWG TaxID=2773266 RepID=UPI00192774CB|nr:polysaccharide biosynthesis protein [Agreia sp. COWG]CAD5993140.1 Polysaccharide transporter, PST family [Agreia sp. COWG]
MKTVLLRLSGFTFFPLLSLITPLLLLPIVAGIVGGDGVSSVISGQSIGTFAATALMWGWNVDGPVAIARATNPSDRAIVYLRSVRTRIVLLVLVLPLVSVVAAAVAVPAFRVEAVSMALATALVGMSPAWFCIGLGQPKLLALYDTIPRFVATLLSVPLLLATQQVWSYTVVLAGATLVSLILFHRRFSAGGVWLPTPLRGALRDLRAQGHTAGISMAGSAYASTPAPIATATTSPAASGSLSTADTLYRFGLFTVIALGNAFQSWTIEPGIANRRQRHAVALWSHVGLGLAGLVILLAAGPWVSELLFAGQARASVEVCLYYGIAFFFLSVGTPLMRNVLIPAGRQPLVLRWTLASAVLGIAAMLVAGLSGHAPLIALGMALSEAVLCAGLAVPAFRELRRHSEEAHVE